MTTYKMQPPKVAESWLWPDQTIGKRQSRKLREDHNRLVNAYTLVDGALRRLIRTWENGERFHHGDPRDMTDPIGQARDALKRAEQGAQCRDMLS